MVRRKRLNFTYVACLVTNPNSVRFVFIFQTLFNMQGSVLQIGRSLVRFQMVSLDFSVDNSSDRTMTLGSTQPLTEMSTMNISWGVKAAGA
jgi:hypothetical protein